MGFILTAFPHPHYTLGLLNIVHSWVKPITVNPHDGVVIALVTYHTADLNVINDLKGKDKPL